MRSKVCVLVVIAIIFFKPMISNAGDSDHGGDALKVTAVSFSNRALLDAAVQLAKQVVSSSSSPVDLKASFEAEINLLSEQNKFLMLPDMLLVEGATNKMQDFVSLGGMTGLGIGSYVYLNARTLSYSVSDLSKLITHEVLHHILIRGEFNSYKSFQVGLASNESFIDELVEQIFSNSITENMQRSLQSGVYVKDFYVDRDSVIGAAMHIKMLKPQLYSDICGVRERAEKATYKLPDNLYGVKLKDIKKALTSELTGYGTIDKILAKLQPNVDCSKGKCNKLTLGQIIN